MSKISRIEFDVRKLKAARSFQDLEKLFQMIGQGRFQQAWVALEKDPVEAASVGIFYCADWSDFCTLAEAYGVNKEQSIELNQRFRDRLKEKNLDLLVAELYRSREAA